jgi:two-component system sensor histidine kinase SenX3
MPVRARLRARLEEQERSAARCREEVAALQRDGARLREVLDALPLGVVVRDERGVEVLRNDKGVSPTQDIQADALIARVLDELLAAGGPGSRVVELHGPPARSVELSVRVLASGGVMATVEDASQRRRLDAVRRDFVDNVNHELRTPIGAIGVLLEALEGETDPEVVRRLLARMNAEVARADELLEDLLELGRIEGRAEPVRLPLELDALLAAAVDRVRPASERMGVRIEFGPVADVIVHANRDELVSAVANLLDNAVKYSERGSSVDLSAAAAGEAVDIVVRDRGIGVPAKDLDRIFERFYRVDPARDRATGGSGLGLSIVRHVAVNHGGEVLVSSVEGEGSTFTLRLKVEP